MTAVPLRRCTVCLQAKPPDQFPRANRRDPRVCVDCAIPDPEPEP